MADFPLQVAGDDTFVIGMDSYTSPTKLMPGEYVAGMNIINRGGIAQTRPGSVSLFDMPEGNIQGCTFFTPGNGIPTLVFAVDGKVYVSQSPFRTYAQLPNILFNRNSKYIAWASCIQSSYYTPEGDLEWKNPTPVLVMQDGATRAAYWDGSTSRHLNPTQSGQEATLPDRDETPVGLWMAWSNNRLWVSRGSQIFASDIGNPLKFTEGQYLNEGRSFYLPGPCTGIVETTDKQGIICFTSESGSFLQSSIQERSTWLSTPNFQQTILPNVGCIAPRSIVRQYGLIWWFTTRGLINQDEAAKVYITSRLNVQDNEMAQSKFNLSYDLSMVAGGFVENFLFHAVPNGDRINTRLHVLDQSPFEMQEHSWPSYWTGWRPVEFARGVISSRERVFCASYDYDGVNRMWELFHTDKTDNGMPITCFLQTRPHLFENRDYKEFRYAEIEFEALVGETAVMAAVAGIKGTFQKIMDKDISATNGQVYIDQMYGEGAHLIAGSLPQTRVAKTQDGSSPSDCNAECVESDDRGLIDKAFSLLIVWSGVGGVSAYRIFSVSKPKPYNGLCEENETGEDRLINQDGCGALSPFSTSEPFESFFASATFEKAGVSHTATQSSMISQQDANRKATTMAQWYVLKEIGEIV